MKRILIIDDDALLRTMLRVTLEDAGYDVADAPDGQQGLACQRAQPADLIITDILMPNKDGIETIIELTRTFPAVKIIAISGGGRVNPEYYLEMVKTLGAQRTFTKPFERAELVAAVRELLEGSFQK